jgi:RNA polymerase sigma-70 factor (ECF subfamily)
VSEGPVDSDQQLVARYLHARDEDAFRELYRAASPAIYGFLMRLTGKPEEAQELLQETWVRAARTLAAFRWESTLATWLRGIALHCWHETRRPDREQTLSDSGGALESVPPPHTFGVDLSRAVAALPEGYRAAIVLHDIEGFTHDEIADRLGIDAGTSRSQLSRARERLRRALSCRGTKP